jgi:hypothetical protein
VSVRPGSFASSSRCTQSGIGAPANDSLRHDARRAASKPACVTSMFAWVGTMNAAVIDSRSQASTNPSTDHGVTNTQVAPTSTAGWNMMLSAATWNSGVTIATHVALVERLLERHRQRGGRAVAVADEHAFRPAGGAAGVGHAERIVLGQAERGLGRGAVPRRTRRA